MSSGLKTPQSPRNGLSPLKPQTPSKQNKLVFYGCGQLNPNYDIQQKLGEGTFGVVSKAIQKSSGKLVALKKILFHNEKDGFPITALREIMIIKRLSHKNVLQLIEMCVEKPDDATKKTNLYMVTPYMSYDLSGLLENPNVKLEVSHIKCFLQQLLEGIQYIHEQHYLHRDIKAANLLIDGNGTLKIGDFGLARKYMGDIPRKGKGPGGGGHKYTGLVVTRWYRAPELVLGDREYTTAVDLWGVGCVFGEMFKHKPILSGQNEIDQGTKIFQLVGSPTDLNMPGYKSLPQGGLKWGPYERQLEKRFSEIGKEGLSLLASFLDLNPLKRITAVDALSHKYFKVEPLPSKPEEIPEFEESHEMDLKRYRTEKKALLESQNNHNSNHINNGIINNNNNINNSNNNPYYNNNRSNAYVKREYNRDWTNNGRRGQHNWDNNDTFGGRNQNGGRWGRPRDNYRGFGRDNYDSNSNGNRERGRYGKDYDRSNFDKDDSGYSLRGNHRSNTIQSHRSRSRGGDYWPGSETALPVKPSFNKLGNPDSGPSTVNDGQSPFKRNGNDVSIDRRVKPRLSGIKRDEGLIANSNREEGSTTGIKQDGGLVSDQGVAFERPRKSNERRLSHPPHHLDY